MRPLVPITLSGIMYVELALSLTANGFFDIGSETPTSASSCSASSATSLMFSSGDSLIPLPMLTTAFLLSKSTALLTIFLSITFTRRSCSSNFGT